MLPSRPPLPDFDERHPVAGGNAVTRPQQVEVEKLRAQVPGVHVDFDLRLGAPKSISANTGFLTESNGGGGAISASTIAGYPINDPYRATEAFLSEHRPMFGHGPEILSRAVVKRDFVTPHNGMRTVVWEQHVDGIGLFGSAFISHVTRKGELVNLSSTFLADPEAAADHTAHIANPEVSARQAVVIAARNIGEEISQDSLSADESQKQVNGVGSEKRQWFTSGALKGSAEAKLVWLPVSKVQLRLCWDIVLMSRARGEMYRVLVDVQNGQPQLRHCLTDFLTDVSYRVFTSDSPSPFSPGYPTPNSGQPPLVERTLVTWSALDTNASPNGWIDDTNNETLGNNVDAHTDRNGNDVPDLPRPQGNPFRVFDFPLDLGQNPTNYSAAAVVQLFYWCNWMHDKLYELGFTEAAGNFQNDNFGRGGIGGDAVQAEAQDGAGVDNANFSTPPDGSPGRMQMYLFTDPTPARDGDLDAQVVLHEYTHGLSNRRVGGGIGITAAQTQGMGEGWSDFYALSLLSEPGDDVNGTYAEGAYVSYQLSGLSQNYYFGIRRYPYCTDTNKNPLTFKDIDGTQASSHPGVPRSPIIGNVASEVHNMGEVWCVTLWDARANLIGKNGAAAGNQEMLQLVTDGMNLSPPNPTFLQARDAVLQADQVDTGGANYNELWTAFAKRGMGDEATCPPSSSTIGVRESFEFPDDLQVQPIGSLSFSSPRDGPVNPACQVFWLQNIGTNTINWTANGTDRWFNISPSSGMLGPGASNAVTICLSDTANWLSGTNYTASVVFSNANSGGARTRGVTLQLTAPWVLFFSLDSDPGWARTGQWAFGVPAGLGGLENGYPDPTAGATGSNVFGVNLAGDYSTEDGSSSYLTAGPFDFSGYTGIQLQFQRWLNTDYQPFVFAGIDLSRDSVNWSNVWNNGGAAITDNAWSDVSYNISASADNQPNVLIRWGQAAIRLAFPYSGWNIDDIGLVGNPTHLLTLSIPSSCTKGDAPVPGSVAVSPAFSSDLTVTLASSDVSSVTVPASVTIPAGQTNVAFTITVVDDGFLDGTRYPMIKASAPRCQSSSSELQVLDNATPTLTVLLPVTAVKSQATIGGEVLLGGKVTNDTDIVLISGDTNKLQVPALLTIPAGQTSAVFVASVIDDHEIDGPQVVSLTAQAVGWVDGSTTITLLDDFNLVVTLPPELWKNAGILVGGGSVQISGVLQNDLEISLSSSDPSRLIAPSTVTIPAGQTTVTFDLIPVENFASDGNRDVTITASTLGFANGSGVVVILDDDTPPVPSSPFPPDGASNVNQVSTLSWQTGTVPGRTITNEVYFGTNPTPGAAELQGSTTNSNWTLPLLTAQTTYYWQVVAQGVGTAAGPVWQFTTRGLDHFSWTTISSPQFVSQPFTVTVSARDPFDNVVSNYSGMVSFQLLGGLPQPEVAGPGFPAPVLSPTNSGRFVNGSWSGLVSIFELSSNVDLEADDSMGHSGVSMPFNVVLTNDISISGTAFPNPAVAGTNLTYTMEVSNSGAADATDVVVTNILPSGAAFVSASSSQGTCTESNGTVTCELGVLTGATNAILTVMVVPLTPGVVLTNIALVSRAEPDPYLSNNSVVLTTTVEIAPTIIVQPTNQTALLGDSASFSVVASGMEPLSYQWSLNGTNLLDATNTSLLLTNVQLSDAGAYAVLVTNSAGFALSSNALLTVQQPVVVAPSILVQPTNQTVLLGDSVSFSVVASGTEPLSYQWSLNGTNLLDATNTSLLLTNVQLSDAGDYAVLVTNSAGVALSSNALLTVQQPVVVAPSILVQPTNQTVLLGDSVSFSVIAFGTEPLSYQWSLNGTNLLDATSTSLLLTNVQLTDAGAYAVLVTNAAGFALSSNALLTVQQPVVVAPSILMQPTNQTVLVGDSVSFSVVASGTEPLSYQWSLNGTNLLDATNTSLVLSNVQLTDAGAYAVLVTNAAGFALSSNALLTVQQPVVVAPSILVQPTNQTVLLGDSVSFSVVASGTEPLSYQWSLNGTNLLDATNRSLLLTNLQLSDAGAYAVLVTNSAGFALSSNALLTVQQPVVVAPSILVQPTNQTVLLGNSVSFSVVASGTEPLSYQWSLNGTNLLDATNTSLLLTNVQLSDAGAYTVLVTNSAGFQLSSNALLTVQTPVVGAPTILVQPTNQTVLLGSSASFSVVASGNEPLNYQWSLNGTNLLDATNTSLLLTNVQLTDSGDYAVLVTNATGFALSSNALLVVYAPDHFAWAPIPSPRFVNVPFMVRIEARDASNQPETNFHDIVILRSTNGVPIQPTASSNFVSGVWTGLVSISGLASNVVLVAEDDFGHTGFANPINVIKLPRLALQRTSRSILISWPSEDSGFILESSAKLSPESWTAVPGSVDTFNGSYQVRLQTSSTNSFYRLRLVDP